MIKGFLVIGIAGVLLLASCGGAGNSATATGGQQSVASGKMMGVSEAKLKKGVWHSAIEGTVFATYTFKDGGVVVKTAGDGESFVKEGTWSLKDKTLTMTFEEEGTWDYTLADQGENWTMTALGFTYTNSLTP